MKKSLLAILFMGVFFNIDASHSDSRSHLARDVAPTIPVSIIKGSSKTVYDIQEVSIETTGKDGEKTIEKYDDPTGYRSFVTTEYRDDAIKVITYGDCSENQTFIIKLRAKNYDKSEKQISTETIEKRVPALQG